MTVDLDREYQPEQLDELGRDLVKMRGKPLDPLEKGTLERWKRDGIAARMHRTPLATGGITCWPADLPEGRPERQSGRSVIDQLSGANTVPIKFQFDKMDLNVLRAAALMDAPPHGEGSLFMRAANSIRDESYLVTRIAADPVQGQKELHDLLARFANAGVAHVTVSPLRDA